MPNVLETPIIEDALRVHQGVPWIMELDIANDDGEPLEDGYTFSGYMRRNQPGSDPVEFTFEYADGVLTISLDAATTETLDYGSYEWRIREPGEEPQVFGKGEVLFSKKVFP